MKYLNKLLCICSLLGCFFTSCEDWTELETKEIDKVGGHNTSSSEEYYASLRAWKETYKDYGRPVSFGWFSNWSPEGAFRKGYLESLPDSIDMISMWSGPFDLTPAKIRDKEIFQKKKGGKLFVCYILHNIGTGITPSSVAEKVQAEHPDADSKEMTELIKKAQEEYWGFTSGKKGSEDHTAAIRRYAKALVDTIKATGYDGLDIDWEPYNAGDGDGSLKNNYTDGDKWTDDPGRYLHVLVEELGKYMGPKADQSANDKYYYLLVDGEVKNVDKKSAPYFDYIISQAYSNAWSLDERIEEIKKVFGEYYDVRKHIFTENFESYWHNGGDILKHAAFNSKYGPKGGVGAFRLDNDYDNVPDYKYMRQAIQVNLKAYEDYINNQTNSGK